MPYDPAYRAVVHVLWSLAGEEGLLGLEVPVLVPRKVFGVPLVAEVGDGLSGGREAAGALHVDQDGGGVGVDDLGGALVAVEAGHPSSHADDGLELWGWSVSYICNVTVLPIPNFKFLAAFFAYTASLIAQCDSVIMYSLGRQVVKKIL